MTNENIKLDKMMYQNNKISYNLAFLGLGFNVVFIFLALNTINTRSYGLMTGFKVIMNIIIMLSVFLSMEKVKVYEKKFSIYLIILGIITIGRIFWLPRLFLKGTHITDKLINSNYQMRAIIQIIFLALTSACFIASGIIGYFRSTALEKHRKEGMKK
ncbi:hypothetical protein BN85406400 [Alteracholeplasma palmae J233]|uniref:Uncharacterized protein n=1 Tax=Alteracholeplasma palmae (strain ATCC 49389 / J233) TaxID=1318466 RepID=U4KKN8_ALTPJ|nr:hypothetical protein [Alteracholeplasma palmae]CCV64217.1 hypothetical protein BN85406400 [Alteracholeplasma palmae J233]